MPEQKESAHFESGPATASPSFCCSSPLDSTNKEYTRDIAATSTYSSGQSRTTVSHSLLNGLNFNIVHQKALPSSSDTADFNQEVSQFSNSSTPLKANLTNLSEEASTDNFASPHPNSASFSSLNNFSHFVTSNNNYINNNTNFESIPISKLSPKNQESFCSDSESFDFQLPEQSSSHSFGCSKISKLNLISSLKQTVPDSNTLLPTNTQTTYCQSKEVVDFVDKNTRLKNISGGIPGLLENYKDESIDDWQQFFSRNGGKVKNPAEATRNLVTDSFLHLLHKKNSQANLFCDSDDINPVLVSLTNKQKAQVSGLKKKENTEDLKLMNEFITKLLSEKEEKRFKSLDEKKKFFHKETFDNLSNELEDRKIKRDAMSHYQEDKNHQKRSSNYGDYNQWEFFSQQDVQPSNNHSRRGHFSFGGTSQQHSVGWNPIGIGMPRQSNPYYANPHGHVMPAHAHSEYRYNQWNNPNHKNIPNIHNAHSQNAVLSQSKMDVKHHSDISNSVQDFGLPIGSTSEFSKYRTASRDLLHRAPSNLTEKSTRSGIHPDHLSALPPPIRNSSSLRTPPISNHPKTVINNPLSDLQMLVTSQDSENLHKTDNFQQESVDLSAHSEISKQKENLDEKSLNGNNKEGKELRSSVSVIQIQNKLVKSDFKESEKPVELTSKCSEKSAETTVSSRLNRKDLEKKNINSGNVSDSKKEITQNEVGKSCEEQNKTSVILEKDEEPPVGDSKKEGDIPGENKECEKEQKGNSTADDTKEKKKEETIECSVNMEKPTVLNEIVKEEPQKCKESNEGISIESSEDPKAKCSENVESSRNCKRKVEDEQISGENKKVFLEVESQSEKISEGVERENLDLPTVTSTSTEIKSAVSDIKKKPKKKPSRKTRLGRQSSGQSSGSERSLSCKKSKGLGNKEEGKKKVKKNMCDVMDRRGPFLHVEGSRESPASVIVVNFPKGDDEDEKEKNFAKKQILSASRTKHHNELDYRGRSRNGLYSSTLSARYDAHTTDHTWVCVFCKKGPHYSTMGDLFGPYIISRDENVSLGDFSGDEKDISDAQKRGGRNKKSLRSHNMVEHFQKMSRKLRRAQSTESCLIGMTLISDNNVDQLRYEVWVHEQCAVWSPNVFLIGSRIIGMQEAIWCSVKTMCSKCGISGANIGCVFRNCPNRSHYHCAKESGWSLEQEHFISTCYIHKSRS